MTTAAFTSGWAPEGLGTQLPPVALAPLAASAQVGRGQFCTYNASGHVALNDGATPGLVCAGVGYPAVLSGISTTAGAAFENLWIGYGGSCPASAETSDSFTAADVCTPCWIADENHLGKLSSFDGDSRSLAGLVFGVDAKLYPRAWVGPVAHAVARGVLMASAKDFAWLDISDAAASTAISERAMPSEKFHGTITAVQLVGAAIAADNADYITVTIAKRVLADAYAAATTIATYDSRAANNGAVTAFTPAAFTLSAVAGALDALETDVYTIVTVKGGSGKTISGAVRVIGKVL